MRRVIYLFIGIFVIFGICRSCLKIDVTVNELPKTREKHEISTVLYPQEKNVTIDGIDYLQSQLPVGKFGGSFITSTIGEGPKTFNPFNAKDNISASMSEVMYDGLVTTHPITGETLPKLAKSYTVNDCEYIINLRHGLKWSDGKPINADDVLFTWNRIIFGGFGNTSTRDSVVIDGKLPKLEKIDDYTVKFTTPKPFAPFLRMLSTPIAPKHIFEPAVNRGKEYFDGFLSTNTPPKDFVTSGAFKLKEYVPAQRVIFERNENYYVINKNNESLPYLDKLIYLIVGDVNNQVLKFEGGELDEISLQGANVARFKEMEKYSNFKIYNIGPDTGTMYIAMNLNNRKNDEGKYYVDLIKQKWFQDKNFRKAVDLAIDRKNMVFNIANGLAEPLFTPETLNSIFLNKELKSYDRNVIMARELLKESGFYNDKQGKLYDSSGHRVEFDLYTNAGNTERESIGVMVKQDLEDLGMKINFKPIEFNSLVNKLMSTLDWDMVIMGFTGSPLEPNGGKNVWMSDGTLHIFNQRLEKDLNSPKYDFEKKLDDLFIKGALAVKFEDRKKYYDEYQAIVYDEKPLIYIYSPIRIVALRNKFKNIYPTSLGGVTHNLEEIYVEGN